MDAATPRQRPRPGQFGTAAAPWLRRGGHSLKIATLNAVYFKINASLVLSSMMIGGDITYLSAGEIELTKKLVYRDNSVQRMWDYWSRRCGDVGSANDAADVRIWGKQG